MRKYKSQVFKIQRPYVTDANYFSQKLLFETDIADLAFDYYHDLITYQIIDVRDKKYYDASHIPGALSFPNGLIPDEMFEKTVPIVVYCWGPSCNAATKAASRILAKGYQVKELLGGLEYWVKENCPVEGSRDSKEMTYWQYDFLKK